MRAEALGAQRLPISSMKPSAGITTVGMAWKLMTVGTYAVSAMLARAGGTDRARERSRLRLATAGKTLHDTHDAL